MSPKDAVLEALNELPADATPDEIRDRIDVSLRGFDDASPQEDPACVEEINRRVEDLESGRVEGIPAENLFNRLREKYG